LSRFFPSSTLRTIFNEQLFQNKASTLQVHHTQNIALCAVEPKEPNVVFQSRTKSQFKAQCARPGRARPGLPYRSRHLHLCLHHLSRASPRRCMQPLQCTASTVAPGREKQRQEQTVEKVITDPGIGDLSRGGLRCTLYCCSLHCSWMIAPSWSLSVVCSAILPACPSSLFLLVAATDNPSTCVCTASPPASRKRPKWSHRILLFHFVLSLFALRLLHALPSAVMWRMHPVPVNECSQLFDPVCLLSPVCRLLPLSALSFPI